MTVAVPIRCAMLLAAVTLTAARDDPLQGYRPGKPTECLSLPPTSTPDVVDEHTILYREGGGRIWKTGPVGSCPALRPLTTLVVQQFGGQLCRNDRFQVLSPGTTIPSASCRFDRFTPYRKVARAR